MLVLINLSYLFIIQNFLNNYGTGDILSSTARLFLLFQMITVLPLLMYLIRNQLYYTICGDPYPGLDNFFPFLIIFQNLLGCSAQFSNNVNCYWFRGVLSQSRVYFEACSCHFCCELFRYVGALCGLVYVFTLPNLIHMRKLHMAGQLTLGRRLFHCSLIAIGALNLLAQIFV